MCGNTTQKNTLKAGISLIVLGNLLYLIYVYFANNGTSNFNDFCNGLLVGSSIGCNLIGIILTATYIAKNNQIKNKEIYKIIRNRV